LSEKTFCKTQNKIEFESAFENLLAKKKHHENKHKRLGEGSIGAALESNDGFVWTGTVYMGRFTPMDVVFDTGSDWLVIESHLCDTCEGNTYDTSESVITGTKISERLYGSVSLKGVEHHDTVCILLSTCVYEFEYFAIYG